MEFNLDGDCGFLTASIAEMLLKRLESRPIDEVGGFKWNEQRETIEKLNLQAHHNARTHSDEFIPRLFTQHNKLDVLVHELLVVEIWREKVFPHLKQHFCQSSDALSWYFVLHHEVVLANLIEVCLFDETCFDGIDDDHLLELVMWCHRKLTWLSSRTRKDHDSIDISKLLHQSAETDLETKMQQIQFSAVACATTIFRYITENLSKLPMAIAGCIYRSQDTVMTCIQLIDRPPWIRTTKNKIEKYIENTWMPVSGSDRFRLCQLEVQVWLALNNLMTDPKSFGCCHMSEFRRAKIIGLRKHFNEHLFDQIPTLKNLEHIVNALCLGSEMASDQQQSILLLEQIPAIRGEIMNNRDWPALAAAQKSSTFNETAEGLQVKNMERLLEYVEHMCRLEETDSMGTNNTKENRKEKILIEARKQIKSTDVWERVFDLTIPFDESASYEVIHARSKNGQTLKGKRYKLDSFDVPLTPMPSEGKLLVTRHDHVVEARLKLPTASTKTSEVPNSIWLTVGSLGVDGFAMQLQVKRVKASELLKKNKTHGYWDVYKPVRAAMTLQLRD